MTGYKKLLINRPRTNSIGKRRIWVTKDSDLSVKYCFNTMMF